MSQHGAELRARFEVVSAFYRSNAALVCSKSDDWGIDPQALFVRTGIKLTAIEDVVWEEIRSLDLVMYPQYPVGPYFVDFGNPVARVAIECDGQAYHQDRQRDDERQQVIEGMGWQVYRISGAACMAKPTHMRDEDGYLVDGKTPARRFVELIASRHPLRRVKRADPEGMTHIADALRSAGNLVLRGGL